MQFRPTQKPAYKPFVLLAAAVLAHARDAGASDLHLHLAGDVLEVRLRFNRSLITTRCLPASVAPGLIRQLISMPELGIGALPMRPEGPRFVIRLSSLDSAAA